MRKIIFAVLALTSGVVAAAPAPERWDVVVVGAGPAGLSAALEARQAKASVLVLERDAVPGGAARMASYGMLSADAKSGKKGEEALYDAVRKSGAAGLNADLAHRWVTGALEAVRRLRFLGADLSLTPVGVGEVAAPSQGLPVGIEVTRTLWAAFDAFGGRLRLNHEVLDIGERKDGARIVTYRDAFGKTQKVRAGAVVIASGLVERAPEWSALRGDWVEVNEEGGRYLSDEKGRALVGWRVKDAIMAQTQGAKAWRATAFDVANMSPETPYWLVLPESQGLAVREMRRGELPCESDLPSLGARLKWSSGLLTEIQKNVPERGAADARVETKTGYCAMIVHSKTRGKTTGLRIDTQARVLNENGRAMPGLYAAGDVTVGVTGRKSLPGASVSAAVVFGRLAGARAARFVQ